MKRLLTICLFWVSLVAVGQTGRDKVYLVDRTVKEGSVIRIEDTQISFEDKNTPGIRTAIRIATIWKIIYSNGFEEVFNQPLPENLVSPKETETKKSTSPLSGLADKIPTVTMPTLKIKQDIRPIVSLDFGLLSPVLISPSEWTSSTEGLAFRFGVGGELGLSINPSKYFGLSVSQGYSGHASYLPNADPESTQKEMVRMSSLPTSLLFNIYPTEDYSISGGLLSTSLSISNSKPEVSNQRLNGFQMGFGKMFYMKSNKNYLNLSLNYTSVSSSAGFQYRLDKVKFPDLSDLQLDFKSLNWVELKLKFYYRLK
jgi:hypothetical protein